MIAHGRALRVFVRVRVVRHLDIVKRERGKGGVREKAGGLVCDGDVGRRSVCLGRGQREGERGLAGRLAMSVLRVLAGGAFALGLDGKAGVARSRARRWRGRRIKEGERARGRVGGVERACRWRRVGADSRRGRRMWHRAGQRSVEALLDCLHRRARCTHGAAATTRPSVVPRFKEV